MLELESVDICVSLSSSFWQDPPKTKVFIDDNLIYEGQIVNPIDVQWTGSLEEGQHKIIVELYDKNKYQTLIENGTIVKDQLINIDKITLDEIDIGFLKHSLSKYYPDKSSHSSDIPECVTECVNLGWNGKWELAFNSPVYIWLLENI